MSNVLTHVTLQTALPSSAAPLRAEISIDGGRVSPPKTVRIKIGIYPSDATELTFDRDKIRSFCQDFLIMDGKVEETHTILHETHQKLLKVK